MKSEPGRYRLSNGFIFPPGLLDVDVMGRVWSCLRWLWSWGTPRRGWHLKAVYCRYSRSWGSQKSLKRQMGGSPLLTASFKFTRLYSFILCTCRVSILTYHSSYSGEKTRQRLSSFWPLSWARFRVLYLSKGFGEVPPPQQWAVADLWTGGLTNSLGCGRWWRWKLCVYGTMLYYVSMVLTSVPGP